MVRYEATHHFVSLGYRKGLRKLVNISAPTFWIFSHPWTWNILNCSSPLTFFKNQPSQWSLSNQPAKPGRTCSSFTPLAAAMVVSSWLRRKRCKFTSCRAWHGRRTPSSYKAGWFPARCGWLGWVGMMFLKVGSESLLLMNPFWGTQKEWEKRQKVDKNLELGGFLGGRSDFLLMFFVDIFTTDVAEPFFSLDENSPKKKNRPRKPAAKPRRHEKFWEWATPLEFHEKHRWMFPKIGGFTPQIIEVFSRVFHSKSSILGYPYFWKHPDGDIQNSNYLKGNNSLGGIKDTKFSVSICPISMVQLVWGY